MEEVTLDLGDHYIDWKTGEKAKDADKAEFWKLIDLLVEIEEDPREEKLVTIKAASKDAAEARIALYYSAYDIEAIRQAETGASTATYEAILVRKVKYTPFTFINHEDSCVYSRQVVEGSQLLDEDRLYDENLALFKMTVFETPWGQRILRPLDKIGAQDLADLAEYFYRGTPTVKLPKPRAATEEELAG